MRRDVQYYLAEHLNVYWLRPECALWDAIASCEIDKLDIANVDIDLGSGNGIFSFITAGGKFSEDFDWFMQADISNRRKNVFDHFDFRRFKKEYIIKPPDIPYRVAFDKKKEMLEQAGLLNWYEEYIKGDVEKPYPFKDGSSKAVFSNILYWVKDPAPIMDEIHRILAKDGKAILCLPDPRFVDFCPSYKSHMKEFNWLARLNRDRAACIKRYFSYRDIRDLSRRHNFKLAYHREYLSRELLTFWDIGFRPVIRPLFKMVGYLTNSERLEVKRDWVKILKEDLLLMVEREMKINASKGFHLVVLQKV